MSLPKVSDRPSNDIIDHRIERRQLEGFEEHARVQPLEEELDNRIVTVPGKKNEPLSSRLPYERDRQLKHLSQD